MRESRNLSQEDLANISDVSIAQITRIERGTVNTTICTAKCLALGLQVRTEELFSFEI